MLLRRHYAASVVTWCRCVVVITTAQLNKAWIQVLCRFKSCSWRVGDSRWWGSLAMVPAGNKAKLLFISTISQNNSSSSSPWVLRTWELFLPSGVFYIALLPAFESFPGADSSTSKLPGLHADLWNIAPVQLFVSQQTTKDLYVVGST